MFYRRSIFLSILSTFLMIQATRDASVRIVGGREALPGEFPMMVQLRKHRNGQHYCGGFLIHERVVVTAAHCTESRSGDFVGHELEAMVGDLVIERSSLSTQWLRPPTRQIIGFSRIIVHEHYSHDTVDNDIAIIQLEKPVKTSFMVNIAAVANFRPDAQKQCEVVGWGRTSFVLEQSSKHLLVGLIRIQPGSICDYEPKFKSERMICAGDLSGKNDSCVGDSGGPLICDGVPVGIVSYGFNCAQPSFAAVYTSVSYHREWILEKMDEFANISLCCFANGRILVINALAIFILFLFI